MYQTQKSRINQTIKQKQKSGCRQWHTVQVLSNTCSLSNIPTKKLNFSVLHVVHVIFGAARVREFQFEFGDSLGTARPTAPLKRFPQEQQLTHFRTCRGGLGYSIIVKKRKKNQKTLERSDTEKGERSDSKQTFLPQSTHPCIL